MCDFKVSKTEKKFFEFSGDEDPETKSIFVKVPLKDDPTFASVNVRELVMFTDVLPKLQVSEKDKNILVEKSIFWKYLEQKQESTKKARLTNVRSKL